MKTYKTVTRPAREEITVDKTICDLCQNEIPRPGWCEVNIVTIQSRTGRQYPEGGSGEEINVDMCQECFSSKLTPWLQSQGVQMKLEEWDW